MKNDRGEYRPFYCALRDDADFHALSWLASRLLVVLKLELPASGIGVVYPAQLAHQCNCTPLQLEEAFAELEQPKPTAGYGWIVRERNIVWLVNGLRFEPNLSPTNAKHRTFVQRTLLPLGDKPRVVHAFREYYPDYFPNDSPNTGRRGEGYPETNGRVSNAYRDPMGSLSKHSDSDSDSDINEDLNSDSDSDQSHSASPATLAFGNMPLEVLRFAREFYGASDADRKEQVRDQLLATLTPYGAKLKRNVFVQARSVEHLSKCCRDVMLEHHAHPLRDPDKAIVVLLKKLQDEPTDQRGRTVGDQYAEQQRERDALQEAYQSDRNACARHWADENPDDAATIEQRATAEFTGAPDSEFTRLARSLAVMDAWAKASGFPDFETWRMQQRPRLVG